MSKTFKPKGYNSLSPYLVVDGAQRMIELLFKIFGARELRKYDSPGGKILHAEVQIDDSVLMLADSNEQYPPNNSILHVYVPDVDETYRKALEAGCEAAEAPKEREGDPDRRGSFIDFSGNMWSVSTQKDA